MCSKYLSKNKSKAKTRAQSSNINHKKLQPKKAPNFTFTDESKYSIKVKEAQFTNFLSEENQVEFEIRLNQVITQITNLNEFVNEENGLDETDNILENISEILIQMYGQEFISETKETQFFKARVKDLFGQSTGFRLFLIKDNQTGNYPVILIDPLHLAIKSRKQYIKPNRYEDNKSNNLCISKIYKKVITTSTFN
ncbi:hypothetical protein MKR36_08155 [Staphylococcus haemolyticus]|uniref:hypothetical protein n=1 Tax=Staphylococcus haemolyticus TaxID=1283 RepID=UPI001F0AF6A3|nr:hypothetical protein [Staphylococcus haemolyticus]MCH4404049.1 hypothetical protein [Staphylococcus haemolyticus]